MKRLGQYIQRFENLIYNCYGGRVYLERGMVVRMNMLAAMKQPVEAVEVERQPRLFVLEDPCHFLLEIEEHGVPIF